MADLMPPGAAPREGASSPYLRDCQRHLTAAVAVLNSEARTGNARRIEHAADTVQKWNAMAGAEKLRLRATPH